MPFLSQYCTSISQRHPLPSGGSGCLPQYLRYLRLSLVKGPSNTITLSQFFLQSSYQGHPHIPYPRFPRKAL